LGVAARAGKGAGIGCEGRRGAQGGEEEEVAATEEGGRGR